MKNIKYTVFTIEAEFNDQVVFYHRMVTREGNDRLLNDALNLADDILTRPTKDWPKACARGEDLEIYIKDPDKFDYIVKKNNYKLTEDVYAMADM